MAEDREREQQERIDILDMEKTPGWKLLKDRLEEEIGGLERELNIDIEGKTAQQIGEEYIKGIQGINGLRRIFQIIEEIKK